MVRVKQQQGLQSEMDFRASGEFVSRLGGCGQHALAIENIRFRSRAKGWAIAQLRNCAQRIHTP